MAEPVGPRRVPSSRPVHAAHEPLRELAAVPAVAAAHRLFASDDVAQTFLFGVYQLRYPLGHRSTPISSARRFTFSSYSAGAASA